MDILKTIGVILLFLIILGTWGLAIFTNVMLTQIMYEQEDTIYKLEKGLGECIGDRKEFMSNYIQ